MRVSLVLTVRNEGPSIGALLDSIVAQARPPDEVLIVDGGSGDGTVDAIRARGTRLGSAPLRLDVMPGCNIAQGRNRAILLASHDLLAVTDGGVVLDRFWLRRLLAAYEGTKGTRGNEGAEGDEGTEGTGEPAESPGDAGAVGAATTRAPTLPPPPAPSSPSVPSVPSVPSAPPVPSAVDVVSGFFVAAPASAFELALGATTLPDADEVDPERFLPSSRSVLFTRDAWLRAGGYPEWLDYCEDLVFDFALRRAGCRFVFARDAVCHYRPRSSVGAFYRQYYCYARGDGRADLWRKRHATRYGAYLAGLALLAGSRRAPWLWVPLVAGGLGYLRKPYRRLARRLPPGSRTEALLAAAWVPYLRLVGDVAKMVGYPVGWVWRLRHKAQVASDA